MATGGFGKGSGPLEGSKAGGATVFGNLPTTPNPPPARSPPAAAAGGLPQPRPLLHPQPIPPQPWQPPRSTFGTLNGMQFLNRSSETPGRMPSPFLTVDSRFSEELHSASKEPERPDFPPHLFIPQNSPPSNSIQQFPSDTSRAAGNVGGTSSPQVPAKFQGPKRIRSPPISSADVPVCVSSSAEMNSEREMQAKAKRLARFHAELSQPAESPSDFSRKNSLASETNQNQPKKVKFPVGDATKKTGDSSDGGPLSDYEGLESYPAICGLCPDMCPESEREERERKGDLDKNERMDGERNQTSISLAVKKYNRTAERDADLIRPLPVLQRTVDYLLDLLNQPYDDQFLGLYNFLWDRMRAIRMDLRMQHIFNHDAIHMLEQMIRLHIIAMHELSENKKGEGFSEGFDAHLNIEQMNKTSVELFQMYDDHRKKGSIIPTEKEFRGYYALLKLDKHPGYKVEPAELSLDLAKMTPEVRCTSEILFARDVARACRTSNFIAFFRLARKATYLQACLMHAHFSKLRTQALASLHSGLQSNQGIPVSHIVKWLAMEGEDIESLLEYHGFSTRKFEEPYMVKEGPFLNSDVDYPTKCSQLVKLKRSKRIVDDVCHGQMLLSPDREQKTLLVVADTFDQGNVENHGSEACVETPDDEMLDYEVDYASSRFMHPQTIIEASLPARWKSDVEDEMKNVNASKVLDAAVGESLYHHSVPSDSELHIEPCRDGLLNEIAASNANERLIQVEEPGKIKLVLTMKKYQDEQAVTSYADDGQLMRTLHENDEAAGARLKLILRIWKQRSSRKREMRERRQSLAVAALSSLPLGPPLRQNEAASHASGDLNIDYVARERHHRLKKLWSTLNASAVVAPILSTRNPHAKCLFWKLALCLQTNDSGSKPHQLVSSWLHRKLMGTGRENDDEHVIYSSNLSVWKKSLDSQVEVDIPQSACYSVVREVILNNNMPVAQDGTMVGLSAVIFLISESIPWTTQKVRLDRILSFIPSGSSLPLLVLSSDVYRSCSDACLTIVSNLGLQNLDKMIISDYSIVFLDGNNPPKHTNGFFSDDHLKGGLRWLAENAPLQPCLRQVKTRDLVVSFLKSSLTALENVKLSEMGPDHCIAMFNEALDRSTEEIRFVADINKNCWPGPEVDFLKELPYDSFLVNMLPSTDWSNDARIEPLIAVIGSCKLPSFPDGLSWLSQGLDGGSDVINQKLALEQCLCSYLTNTVGLVGGNLAAVEASVMIQKGTGLELRGNHYYMIPRWVEIFRRIYHWRLMRLSSGKFTSAYVLERGIPVLAERWSSADLRWHSLTDLEMVDLEGALAPQNFQQLHSASTQVSLDELIEMSCIPPLQQHKWVNNMGQAPEGSLVDVVLNTDPSPHKSEYLRCSDTYECQKLPSSPEQNKETRHVDRWQGIDKLNTLLEMCKRQQDMNDKILAIYF